MKYTNRIFKILKLFGKPRLILNKINFIKEEKFLIRIYNKYIENNSSVKPILELKIDNSIKNLIGERNLPSNEIFQKNGWNKKMLLRYALAIHFSRGKDVLETCSGLGWGAYLLDGVAKSVTCIEKDAQSINLSKKMWNTNRTLYLHSSVLKIPIEDNKYDIVTAMESIEHFKLSDIKKYLSEIYRVLKPGGFLIGSSIFPETKEEANILRSRNKFHLYICTRQEIEEILRKQGFRRIKVFQNRLFFIARK